jgi:hypothetical protein
MLGGGVIPSDTDNCEENCAILSDRRQCVCGGALCGVNTVQCIGNVYGNIECRSATWHTRWAAIGGKGCGREGNVMSWG